MINTEFRCKPIAILILCVLKTKGTLLRLGISYVISVFCTTTIGQNAECMWRKAQACSPIFERLCEICPVIDVILHSETLTWCSQIFVTIQAAFILWWAGGGWHRWEVFLCHTTLAGWYCWALQPPSEYVCVSLMILQILRNSYQMHIIFNRKIICIQFKCLHVSSSPL